MGLILMLKRTVNKKDFSLFSKQNLFYSYFTLYRWSLLAIGHWPDQNKLYSFLMKIYQIFISAMMMKGQVSNYLITEKFSIFY